MSKWKKFKEGYFTLPKNTMKSLADPESFVWWGFISFIVSVVIGLSVIGVIYQFVFRLMGY